MKGFVLGLILGSAVAAFAEVTAPNFPANDSDSIAKCIAAVTADTKVSFPLTAEGELNLNDGVCWPEGIK